ncbi:tetratricopeptide repeat protein [candidate division GN15 bacterium]|nr:tetratricopeptide repeat protein [candidate division GN15 bacterium]
MDAPFGSPDLRYIDSLGQGGTAVVARAFSQYHQQEVAVKYPLPKQTDEVDFAGLATREYDLIGSYRFPGLVRILAPPATKPDYLLLELCSGPTLDSIGQLTETTAALNLISAAALDLEFLHAAGLVHGDLKPSNFFLPSDWQQQVKGGLFYLKLSDFSLGRRYDEPESARLGLGTVGYMAPETISKSHTSAKSELFALGVVAYQLLSGRHPFLNDGADPVQVNGRIQEGDYTPLSTIRPDLNSGVVALVDQLLAVNDSDRPESAWQVCERLAELGATHPFPRALRPGHLIARNADMATALARVVREGDSREPRLRLLSEGSPDRARLILTANYLRGNLRYHGGRFAFDQTVYWPACLRRRALREFGAADLSQKRRLVAEAAATDVVSDPRVQHAEQPTICLLLAGMLRQATVKRLAPRLADRASSDGDYERAARLYTRAGDLTRAAECADQAALALERDGEYRRAALILDGVTDYAEMLGEPYDVRQLHMTRGDIEKRRGEVDRAMAAYEKLIALYEGREVDKLLAEAYKDIGDLYKMRQETAEGLAALEKALSIFEELGDDLEISHTLNNIGNLHWLRGERSRCRACYLKALRIQRRLNAPEDIASSLNNLASSYAIQGRLDRAQRLFRHAVEGHRLVGDQAGMARALNNLGYATQLQGQLHQAVDYLRTSLEINRRIGNKKEIMFNLDNLTSVMLSAGQLRDSLTALREGLELAEAQSDKPHLASFYLRMGTVYKRMGRVRDSAEYFRLAESSGSEVDDITLPLEIEVQRGSLHLLVGDHEGALAFGESAVRRAVEAELPYQQLDALLLVTRIRHNPDYQSRADSLTSELRLGREARLARFNCLEALLNDGSMRAAQEVAEELLSADPVIPSGDDIERARMALSLAEVLLHDGNSVEASKYLTVALSDASRNALLPESAMAHTLHGRLSFDRGDYEVCYDHFKKGLQTVKTIAETIDAPQDKARFQQQRLIVYLVEMIKKLGQKMARRA